MTGVINPTKGHILVEERDVFKEQKLFRTKFGVLFNQKPSFMIDLTVKDNLIFFKEMYRLDDETYEKNLAFCNQYLDIEPLNDKQYRKLSYGERTKCEIISILLHEPKYIFLDEPTNGLDIKSKKSLYDLLYAINQKNHTTIFVITHELEYLTEYFQHVLVLKQGELLCDANMKETIFLKYQQKSLRIHYNAVLDEKQRMELKEKEKDVDEQQQTVSYLFENGKDKQQILQKVIQIYDIQAIEEVQAGVKEVYEYLMEKNPCIQ